ncbi:MAG: DUF4328 domain-containing protein, partial [Opitutales bacterium]
MLNKFRESNKQKSNKQKLKIMEKYSNTLNIETVLAQAKKSVDDPNQTHTPSDDNDTKEGKSSYSKLGAFANLFKISIIIVFCFDIYNLIFLTEENNNITSYSLLSYVISVILFFIWFFKLNSNKIKMVKDFNLNLYSQLPLIKPKWAVGYFFIPILNLYKPYIAMKQAWFVLNKSEYESDKYKFTFIKLWWAFLILRGFIDRQYLSRSENISNFNDFVSFYDFVIILSVINLLLTVFTIIVVDKMTILQNRYIMENDNVSLIDEKILESKKKSKLTLIILSLLGFIAIVASSQYFKGSNTIKNIEAYYCLEEGRNYEAFNLYKKSADQGNAVGQCSVANLYYTGEGVKQDYNKAFEYFEKAADQGNAEGQAGLGNLYYTGEGVKQDYKKAFEYFKKAADQGNAEGQALLGGFYYRGIGV